MTAEAEPVTSGGWRIEAAFAASVAARHSRNFYAVYAGDAFGHAERGIIAAIARAHPEAEAHEAGARDSAQLTVHSMAEGYFGAQRTLSSQRAASLAITAVNRWLTGQIQTGSLRNRAPVSLTALLFHQSKLGIAQVGACQIYRCRGKTLAPLMRDHARPLPEGRRIPTRAIGLDLELSIDYSEEPAELGDRFILLAGLEHAHPDALYATLTEQLAAPPRSPQAFATSLLAALRGLDVSVMVLEITATPQGTQALAEQLTDLPLRPAPRDGDVWDGFTLGQTLYRGSYTMLKAAYDTIEKREVVLKIPLPSMLQDEVFTAGFMREAWIGSTVRGAAVARYLDLPPDRRSSLYLVMPLYKGETLEARLRRSPAITLPDGIGIALKLCEAVQDLAAIQIVHRDIKPENIMLLENNEIRLLDLGLAYLPGIDVATAMKPGGTIRYMAPELLQGTGANARTEVYALAITLYRMFTGGAYPFGQREPIPLARLRPDLPRWLGQCLAQALAPKPTDRFADAGEFACALQLGLVSGAENHARPPKTALFTQLRLWQALTILFAATTLFMLLRGIR